MKISTRSRYGLRFMVELASHYPNKTVLLKQIALAQELSQKYLSLLVIPLKGAGLINSSRGAHGGYLLAKHPKDISVLDVVEILEGDIVLVECVRNPSICKRLKKCHTYDIWCELSGLLKNKMRSTTLADLLHKTRRRVKK